nr:hypothetical protein [Tanacetum cinerariifolium]
MEQVCLSNYLNFVTLVVVTTLVSILLPSIGLNQVPWNELDLPDFTMIERVYLLVCIVVGLYFKLDVNNAFLYDDLVEDVYMSLSGRSHYRPTESSIGLPPGARLCRL